MPLAYHREGLDREVLAAFDITGAPKPDLSRWETISRGIAQPEGEVTIAIVGKYTGLKDAYKSLIEALVHGGIANRVKVKLEWIESEIFEREDAAPYLEGVNGILVPGGFGERGSEGKILAVKFARQRGVPYFGICFGMQMACLEAARSLAGIEAASSTEFGETPEPVIAMMTEWMRGNELEQRRQGGELGGTMRLGAYDGDARRGKPHRQGLWHDADLGAPPPPLRGQHALSRRASSRRACDLPGCRRTVCCPRRSNIPTTRGSSACSITPN